MRSISQRTQHVKTYVELNIEALRRRMERPLMAWGLSRSLSKGCPYVTIKRLTRFVETQGLCHRQTIWRAVRDGMGTLFRAKVRGRLYFRGAREVAEIWGVDLTQHPVFLAIDKLSSLKRIRQGLVASFCTNRDRTISAAKLGELVARTPRWARAYLTQPDIEKQPNIMISEQAAPPFGQAIHPDLACRGYHRTRVNGQWRLARYLPNTYRADFGTAPYGIVGYPTASSSLTRGKRPKGALRRVFYHRPKAQPKAVNRLQDGQTVFLAQGNTKDFWGARIWHGWTRQWGAVGRC